MVNEFALKQVLSNEQPEEVPDDEGQNDGKDGADSEEENEDDDMEMEISDNVDTTEPNCSPTSSGPRAEEGEPFEEIDGVDEEYEDEGSTTAEEEDE